jgi:acyl-CoA synthetase (AMP-forming)/AMP-acid ligase II/pimeloyl-ACP methyl ester carboxylesterase
VVSTSQPASRPPAGLPGLDPTWSRLVTTRDSDGVNRTWHVLDSFAERVDEPELTLLCVHGNPTWSYLWRRVLAEAPSDVRVIAVDQLDMGYSERTGTIRRLEQRVDDLGSVVDALNVRGPVVTVAHDWGGPVSLGWVLRHRDRVRGVVLLNTAVHQPEGSPAPTVIRLARSGPVLRLNTVSTPAFVRATTAMSRSMPKDVVRAFAAPYSSADRREAVGAFVADIPLEPEHPSAAMLDSVAEGVRGLAEIPVLLLWGPGDPVFSDRYLTDLQERMPHADVHRYEGARHLVSEDAPALVGDLLTWVADLRADAPPAPDEPAPMWRHPLWSALETRAAHDPTGTALTEWTSSGWRVVTWGLLARNVDRLARGLAARGIRHGDRVAVLIRPGADLLAVVYACWRIGASVVVTDAGLGARGMHRALRGAGAKHVIAIPQGLSLVRATGLPGRRISTAELPAIASDGTHAPMPSPPAPDAEAAVVFTSGSTGPAKGVVYRHHQVERTRDLLLDHYSIAPEDVLVAAFAPWAVLGPALGIASVLPDMDVTSPKTLKATALAEAVRVGRGTLLWASPAAFGGVVDSAVELTVRQREAFTSLRLVLGAGAPVPVDLLHAMGDLCPDAEIRTPYGMTEALPLCDVTLDEIETAGHGDGVLVGRPLPGVEVRISAVDAEGLANGPLTAEPGVLGEVVVAGRHVKDRYDRLWATERASSRDAGWHRTGDVGQLDDQGRLWIGGRLAHVITTSDGPLAPVGVEQSVMGLDVVRQAACVGVGPRGVQQVVVIVVTDAYRTGPADLPLIDVVRGVAGVPVAAVLERRELPVDIRHNSKVDRTALAEWADKQLAGRGSVA